MRKLPLRFSETFLTWLPFLLGAAGCAGTVINARDVFSDTAIFQHSAGGSFLLAGFPSNYLTYSMPFFGTLMAAFFNLGLGLPEVMALLHPAIYALVFWTGRAAGGYWAGTGSLASLVFFELVYGRYNVEQVLYSFFLLLVLCTLLAWRRGGAGNRVLTGLAVGMSVMTRAPLFFFPPLLLAVSLAAGRERLRDFLIRSALFLASAYILLVPWGLLNRWMLGEFSMVNRVSAADNVISGALGAVYTMEGDSSKLAGLGPDESAEKFFFRTVFSAPVPYFISLARRLWHIFLFQPLLFGAFAAALFFNRRKSLLPAFSLPVCFILVHSAFSVEERYFYPMPYLMLPLIFAVLSDRLGRKKTELPEAVSGPARLVFISALAAVLAVDALVIAYPARAVSASRDPALAAARFPRDRTLGKALCGLALEKEGYTAYMACLESYVLRFGDAGVKCSLSAFKMKSPEASALPEFEGFATYCLATRMLRGLELGDRAYAAGNYSLAMGEYFSRYGMLRGEPYSRDRELASTLKLQTGRFWDDYVAGALSLWPPERRPALAAALRREFSPPSGFGAASARPGFNFMLPNFNPAALVKPAMPKCSTVSAEKQLLSKKINDEAVKKIMDGDKKGGAVMLDRALAKDPSSPESLMTLCSLHASSGRTIDAAEACGLAFCSVYLDPSRQKPGLTGLASEAASQRYALLIAAGRKKEAAEFYCAYSALLPSGWPRPGRDLWAEVPCAFSWARGRLDPCAGLTFRDAR